MTTSSATARLLAALGLMACARAVPTMTGVAAGDAICQGLASKAGLSNSSVFKAWLSNDTTGAGTRYSPNPGPWVNVLGIVIVTNLTALTSGPALQAPINVTELGTFVGEQLVWTGTSSTGFAAGTAASALCQNWTSAQNTDPGEAGGAGLVSTAWTALNDGNTCNEALSIYCIED